MLKRLPTFSRQYHLSDRYYIVDKHLLGRLRKTTGLSYINCRRALEKFDNDIKRAEEWLKEQAQKEGWTKASKLQGRPMSQGLIGIIVHDNTAAMVEVNCETDFVARNNKFQRFVSLVANACLQFGSSCQVHNKLVVDRKTINSVLFDGKTIADLTALEVGNIGENIAVRRAVYMHAIGQASIASYAHATGPHSQVSDQRQCSMGKYGALVLYEEVFGSTLIERSIPLEELGRQLCQHVVGMNPRSLGSLDDIKPQVQNTNDVHHSNHMQQVPSQEMISTSQEIQSQTIEDHEPSSMSKMCDDEERMLHQEFMLDTSLCVGNVLQQNGINILDIARLECGETILDEKEICKEPILHANVSN